MSYLLYVAVGRLAHDRRSYDVGECGQTHRGRGSTEAAKRLGRCRGGASGECRAPRSNSRRRCSACERQSGNESRELAPGFCSGWCACKFHLRSFSICDFALPSFTFLFTCSRVSSNKRPSRALPTDCPEADSVHWAFAPLIATDATCPRFLSLFTRSLR